MKMLFYYGIDVSECIDVLMLIRQEYLKSVSLVTISI